jgi:hypothetical protein
MPRLSDSGHSSPPADGSLDPCETAVLQAQDFSLPPLELRMLRCSPSFEGEVSGHEENRVVRQLVAGPLAVADLKQQTEKGWKLVALDWEREVETVEDQLPADVPFGQQIGAETQRLEENPAERKILFQSDGTGRSGRLLCAHRR